MSRYSQLYIDQSTPLPDSERARHRLGKILESMLSDGQAHALAKFWERELGVKAEAYHVAHLPPFLAKCALRDFLDAITLTFTYLDRTGDANRRWLIEARRVFSEERLAFEIDDRGIVHPAVDKEFQRNRQATVAGLQLPRYAN